MANNVLIDSLDKKFCYEFHYELEKTSMLDSDFTD